VARVPVRMEPRKLIPIGSAAVLLVAATAGCGGGKDPLSAAELVQKGDAICRDEQSRFSRIQAQPPTNASVAADQTKGLVDAAEDAGSDLRDLEPPEDLRSSYDRYLDARDRAVDQIRKGEDAADDRDSRAYGTAQAAVANTAPSRQRLARALGFAVCSRSGQTP
jgi:hypothetical protein